MKSCEDSRTFAKPQDAIHSESSPFADSLYIGKKKGGWRRFASKAMIRFLLGVVLGAAGLHALVVWGWE